MYYLDIKMWQSLHLIVMSIHVVLACPYMQYLEDSQEQIESTYVFFSLMPHSSFPEEMFSIYHLNILSQIFVIIPPGKTFTSIGDQVKHLIQFIGEKIGLKLTCPNQCNQQIVETNFSSSHLNLSQGHFKDGENSFRIYLEMYMLSMDIY